MPPISRPPTAASQPSGSLTVRGVELHGTLDHVDFVLPGRLVNTSTIARDLLDRCARKQRYEGTAGRGITNAHVPCGHQRDPITRALLRHLNANFQALLGLSTAHGWLTCHVGRPGADLPDEQTGQGWELDRDPDIYDAHFRPGLAG